MNLDDTIVAIATPDGRGGIGVVRLAGPEAKQIALPMLRLKHQLEAGRAIFGELIEPEDAREGTAALGCPAPQGPEARIDEVVVTYFAKPHSYTTDDIVEISAHGSPIVLHHIIEIALARGARIAEPGEFTMRAFLNGRIDLTQAEAVRDLIESQTLYQAKVAAQQLDGALSHRLQPIKKNLIELIATLEAGIDFAEDDISVLPPAEILRRIADIQGPLEEMARSFAYGKIVCQGFTLAIVGRPNVGKSSLFNRLVERERAIVTAMPGTTRDLVTETVAIGGIPVHLIDTAGIRRALDEAESIGIRKSFEALADADLILIVLDSTQKTEEEDRELLSNAKGRRAVIVENKSDLSAESLFVASNLPRVRTSAATGAGITELRAEILRHIRGDTAPQTETGFLTSARHQSLVNDSLAALQSAVIAVGNRIPHEMLLLDLYTALRALDEITGATTTDDILNLIFSRFCIGK
ncbi:MAG: tRNA uridine-5-carboxymethylaminomethyl(34) synthesis GTPase MnmE [Terriglobales bacterium]